VLSALSESQPAVCSSKKILGPGNVRGLAPAAAELKLELEFVELRATSACEWGDAEAGTGAGGAAESVSRFCSESSDFDVAGSDGSGDGLDSRSDMLCRGLQRQRGGGHVSLSNNRKRALEMHGELTHGGQAAKTEFSHPN
jgi:hypothetical protein